MTGPAPANPRVVKLLIGGFVFAAIAVTIWGFFVVGDAKRTAAQTDREVRAAAWLLLVAADRAGGMPPSEEALLEAAAVPMPASIAGDADFRWPAKAIDAGLEPGEEIVDWSEAFDRVRVVFAEDRPPRVTVVGLPTRNGTLDEVNGWIEAWAESNTDAAAR